jgi:hypothetical protein
VTIPELYGLFDLIISDRSNEILSNRIRACSLSDQSTLKWIILNGPIDFFWIETMDFLLNDNKVLGLFNNQRIYLGPYVKMMFEIDDHSQAFPATVSRCGMIYFDSDSMLWKGSV